MPSLIIGSPPNELHIKDYLCRKEIHVRLQYYI